MRLTTIVGARPQFIKAAMLSRSLCQYSDISHELIHTGQHYDHNLSDIFFDELDIPAPNYSIRIGSASHGMQTGRMLEQIEKILLETQPDCVLVYGDTNSTLAGALAAAKLRIPIAHVEAGLRSHNRNMPEETNRIVTDHVSELLFSPTRSAVLNLKKEGITGNRVHQVGDIMYDAVLHYASKSRVHGCVIDRLGLSHKDYVLATIHRAENVNNLNHLQTILRGLQNLAEVETVVIPLHPRTRKAAETHGLLNTENRRFYCIEPVGYLDMLTLEENARLVITDSGGVQKEAFFLRVPCLTIREETEWVELIENGWNQLIHPTKANELRHIASRSIICSLRKNTIPEIYGDGNAADHICKILCQSNLCRSGSMNRRVKPVF